MLTRQQLHELYWQGPEVVVEDAVIVITIATASNGHLRQTALRLLNCQNADQR